MFDRFARLALTVTVLAWCGSASAEEPAPPFTFEFKRADDRAVANVEAGKATIAIDSPTGISHATVERTGEAWPESVTLRLNLRGLEHFSVKNGDVSIDAEISSTNEAPRIRVGRSDSKHSDGRALESNDPWWMEVRSLDAAGKPTEEIPLPAGGVFEIRLPRAFFEKNPKSIELEWIDFYRG